MVRVVVWLEWLYGQSCCMVRVVVWLELLYGYSCCMVRVVVMDNSFPQMRTCLRYEMLNVNL